MEDSYSYQKKRKIQYTKYTKKRSEIYRRMMSYNHRESNRKERSVAELNNICKRYVLMCGTVKTYNINDLTEEQKKAFYNRKPIPNLTIKES